MKWVLLCFLSLSLVSACGPACQAYVWGYPLWHSINQRYVYLSTLYPGYQPNNFSYKQSSLSVAGIAPQLAVCNATLCSGQPSTFNPSPISATYVFYLYGIFSWDLGTKNALYPGGALKFAFPPNSAGTPRYASLVLYDEYSNIVYEYSLYQSTTTPIVFCLARISNHPACATLAPGYITWVIPRTGFAVVRVYSDGTDTGVCGANNCQYMLGISQNFGVIFPPLDVVDILAKYDPFMNQAVCPYVYNQPPCGNLGNGTTFWQALCVALADHPVTGAEAAYVETSFGALGIHPTGCDNAHLALDQLNPALLEGYNYVANNLANTGFTSGPWVLLPFNGNWNVHDQTSALFRSISSYSRSEFISSNDIAIYWAAFTDTSGVTLSGANNATYKIVWKSTDAFADPQYGFWTIHLYDSTFYLYNPPAGTDQRQYAVLGTGVPSGEIHIANTCVGSCLRSPCSGSFNLMFRIYLFYANIGPNGGYPFPDIIRCPDNSPCN